MDADRFDTLTRSLTGPTRRHFSRALAGLGLVGGLRPLLDVTDAEAKKKGKKKKQKCKKTQKKCGQKCIPLDGCCPVCSNREICSFGFCICTPGTMTCGDLCCVTGAEVCLRENLPDGTARFRCLPT